MFKEESNMFSMLLFSCICIFFGIAILADGSIVLTYNFYLFALFSFLLGIYDLFRSIARNDNKKKLIEIIIRIFLDFLFTMLLLYKMDIILASATIILGIYILVHSLLHLLNYILYRVYNIGSRIRLLFNYIVTFILGIILVISPVKNMFLTYLILGIYLIFLGLSKLNDLIIEVMPIKTSNKIKSKVIIQMPVLFAMLIPKRLIKSINSILKVDDEYPMFYSKKEEKAVDLEVLIHLAESGSASFGHVEISFEGKTYSFGNYDAHSRMFFDLIGDGVICIADRDAYLNYALENKDRYVVSFGLNLTDKQKQIVKDRINKLINFNTKDYYPDLELYQQGKLPKNNYNDMSSEIYRYANGRFKKIVKGRNKKFFVLKTNCVMVANSILTGINGNLVTINGIISPGSYYDYFNNEFLKKNSIVVSRIVYTKKTSN